MSRWGRTTRAGVATALLVGGVLLAPVAVDVAPVRAQGPGQPPGQGQVPAPSAGIDDPDEVRDAAAEGMLIVAEEAALLDALGAFRTPMPPPLGDVLAAVRAEYGEVDTSDRQALLDELAELDAAGEDELFVLLTADIPVSREVTETLGATPDQASQSLANGTTGFLEAGPYLSAIDDLANRNGRAPEGGTRGLVSGSTLALRIEAGYAVLAGEVPVPDSTTAAPSTTGDPPGLATDGSQAAGDEFPWVALVVGVLALVALAAAVVLIRRARRATVAGTRFDDLLEVSRTLALARTTAEVERITAAEAARLLGGDGTTGAVCHRSTEGLALGHETTSGVLVPERLGDGLLGRVVETGQTVVTLVEHEPAIRSLPAALVAVPVIGAGRVEGVTLAVRTPDRPFSNAEVELLHKLAPITAAALDSARHADAASTASLTDPLTQVGNRRKLEQDLAGVLAQADGPTSLLMLDLDHFKSVNDRHGHPAGDALLRAVADAVRTLVRPGDEVYRYGGEEFAVVLPTTEPTAAHQVAERVRTALRATAFALDGAGDVQVTTSIGVASTTGGDDGDALGLVSRADRALYEAKQAGRDRVV